MRKKLKWATSPEYFSRSSGGDRYRPDKSYWRKKRRKQLIHKFMARHGCSSCGFNDVRALQFNHKNPDDKLASVLDSTFLYSAGREHIKLIFKEIRKCEILCANCHNILSREQGHLGDNRKLDDNARQRDFENYWKEKT